LKIYKQNLSPHPENPNQVKKCKKNIHVVSQKSGLGFSVLPIINKLQNMLLIVTYKGSKQTKKDLPNKNKSTAIKSK
jgi:hypothetical protein